MPTSMTLNGRRGFTLMELLVAITIASFMLFVFNAIFNESVRAVRRGAQTSDIVAKARSFQQQLQWETSLQLQSGAAGFDPTDAGSWGSRMRGPRGALNGTANDPGGYLIVINHRLNGFMNREDRVDGVTSDVRSDQLVFVVSQAPTWLTASTRSMAGRLQNIAPATRSAFSGDPTNGLGSEYVRMWYGHVRQLLPDGSIAPGVMGDGTGHPDQYAMDWVLGRHALFLTGTAAGLPAGDIFALDPATATAHGAADTSDVRDDTGTIGVIADGYADVTQETLAGLTDETTGYLTAAASLTDYRQRAFGQGIYPGSLAFNNRRLTVHTNPRDTNLTSLDVARMHPYFLTGVSDFVIDFAMDLDNDTNVLNFPVTFGDGEIDRIDIDNDGNPDAIRWYSAYPNYPAMGAAYDEDMPLTFPLPTAPLIDAYIANAGPYGEHAFVWGHEGSLGDTRWPWLLRIRYRLHDRFGDFHGRTVDEGTATQQQEPGQWFETIIPVNRQPITIP